MGTEGGSGTERRSSMHHWDWQESGSMRRRSHLVSFLFLYLLSPVWLFAKRRCDGIRLSQVEWQCRSSRNCDVSFEDSIPMVQKGCSVVSPQQEWVHHCATIRHPKSRYKGYATDIGVGNFVVSICDG